MQNEQDQDSHPEGDNHVARSDEHDRKEKQGAKHNILKKGFLCRSDRHDHEASAEIEEDIREAENIGVHVDVMDGCKDCI